MDKRPDRHRNAVVPHVYIDGVAETVAFERSLGAAELFRATRKDGKIMRGKLVSGTKFLRGQRPAYAEVSGAR